MSDSRKDRLEALRKAIGKGDLASAAELLSPGKHPPSGPASQPAETPDEPMTLVGACGGGEAAIGRWKYHLLRRSLGEVLPDDTHVATEYAAVMRGARQRFDELEASAGLCMAANARGEDLLFVSVETCGRDRPLFLAGMMYFAAGQFMFEQCLARTPEEEPAIVQAVLDRCEGVQLVVTFNSRIGDMELVRRRAGEMAVSLPDRMPPHLNLRAEFRKRWKGRLRSFSSRQLERFFFGRQRKGAVAAATIPEIYRHFLETSDAAGMRRVFESNMLDLLTMAQLLCAALTGYEPPVD